MTAEPQPPPGPGPIGQTLQRARLRAAQVLRLEDCWPILLPALAATGGFAVLALLLLPQRLPFWLHLPLVLLLAGFVASRVWQAVRRTAPASGTVIDRRIEQRSGLLHRPLQTLLDRPAGAAPDAVQRAVWQAHRERAQASLHRLRAGPPRLGLRDHYAGRLSLALLPALLLAGIVAGTAVPERLASGFLPGLFEPPGPMPWMQAWITPPDYARTAPVFLTDPHGETTMPFGSLLQVSLTGLHGAPQLASRDLDPDHPSSGGAPGFTRLAEGSWSLSRTLDGSIGLSLRGNGRALADWTIRIAPLPATLVAWDGMPGAATGSGEPWRTRLPWRVGHPYGLNALVAEVRLADPGRASDAPPMPPLQVAIPLEPGTRQAHGVAVPDLSADPRAGEAVIARLVASDVTGHVTPGPEARFTLPARPFRNPLARAVLDVRRRVALGREGRSDGANDLQALAEAPGPFASDTGMALNFASLAALLREDDVANAPAIDEATGRLWELALALEDGLHNDRPGARAAADVRAARSSVAEQLERMRQLGDKGQFDKEQSELERRIQALSQAIARRMQALAEQARREHTTLPPMPDARMLSGADLGKMMQQMRDAAAHGHPQDAMRQLAQMQSMLDRMRAATPQDLQSLQEQAEAQRQAHEQTEALQDLVRRQSGLLDQTQSRRNARDKEARDQSQSAGMDPQAEELLRRLGIPQAGDQAAGDQAGDAEGGQPPGLPTEEAPGQAGGEAANQPPDAPPSDGSTDAPENFAPNPANSPAQRARDQAARAAADQARGAQQRQDARVQHSLGRALDELGQEFKALSGAQPGGFDDARRAMGSARAALSAGHDQLAQDAQQQALADLQKGARQMQQALASGQGGAPMLMPGMSGGSGGAQPGEQGQDEADGEGSGSRDPLGRPVAGGPHADDGDTHVPDKAEQMRAREIEQELRRRDTDRTRTPDELHYLDRLLKPF